MNISEKFAKAILVLRLNNDVKLTQKDIQYLEVYFRSNCSLKTAAAELYIHKNTLQYRLDRVRDLSGYDPRLFADAADLMLALKCRMLLQGQH